MTETLMQSWIVGLLGRESPPRLGSESAMSMAGARVAVTGAAGSIGSEIVRQCTTLGADVFLLDVDESRMHAVKLEMSGRGLLDDDTVVLADIRDRNRMQRVLRDIRPDIVFHAAAHKHLQLLERYPCEAVKANVLGTENTLRAAIAAQVERFVLVSTDKAADPSSMLGASKNVAEQIVAHATGGDVKIAAVRFGNVLGSRGSLLDTLRWQLARGLPIQITDECATRYFMSIPEAVGLVLDVGTMATTAGGIYVLDMGEPVRIVDIVERLAALMGVDVAEISYCGLREGEKLHERLFAADEDSLPTANSRINVTPAVFDRSLVSMFSDRVNQLCRLAARDNDNAVRMLLSSIASASVAQRRSRVEVG